MIGRVLTGIILIMTLMNNLASAGDGIRITWGKPVNLPPATGEKVQYGVAGPLTGMSHGALIVAGGANFNGSLPWKGATKIYHDEIFILETASATGKCVLPDQKLEEGIAYSACVSFNNRVVCLGGENSAGPVSKVCTLEYSSGKLLSRTHTPLPQPVTAADAAVIGSVVYLVGGSDARGAVATVYCADLSREILEWKALAPLPVPLSNLVLVSQSDGSEMCLWVLGGRNKSGITSTFYPDILKYSPSKAQWTRAGQITDAGGTPVGLSAGTGVAAGDHLILLFSGDPGIVFNRTERLLDAIAKSTGEPEKQALVSEKNKGLETHPGFHREVLLFNTLTGKMTTAGQTPGPGQVTTKAVLDGNTVWIPSGEIRPGVRTPEITWAHIEIK